MPAPSDPASSRISPPRRVAALNSFAFGRIEVSISAGCECFIGRYALLAELRAGNGLIGYRAPLSA